MIPKKINREAVAHNMKLIRNLTGMTMHDFAAKLNISKDQVNNYEAGRSVPSKPIMLQVCQMAGITEEQLISKHITKEEIVKEMFVVLRETTANTTGENESLAALQKTVESLQRVIETQSKTIENLTRMLDSFSKDQAAA